MSMSRVFHHIAQRFGHRETVDQHTVCDNMDANAVDETAEAPGDGVAIVSEPVMALPSVEPPSVSCDTATPIGAIVEDGDQSGSACQRRHRRHHHHRRRHHRLCRIKWKEVNFLAAMSNVVAAVLVCTSLMEPHWWYISGGKCRDNQQTISYLGVKLFFLNGHFDGSSAQPSNIYYYGSSSNDVLIDCITQSILYAVQAVIALCFLAIMFSLMAIVVDLITVSNCAVKAIRHSAVFSVLAVCTCVSINILSYLVTQQLAAYYETTHLQRDSKIDVEFSLSFYMIMAAGIVSVFAVAFTLMCRQSHGSTSRWSPATITDQISGRRRREDRLLDNDYNQLDRTMSVCSGLPPLPPPYSP